jgi:hypothetical protein
MHRLFEACFVVLWVVDSEDEEIVALAEENRVLRIEVQAMVMLALYSNYSDDQHQRDGQCCSIPSGVEQRMEICCPI